MAEASDPGNDAARPRRSRPRTPAAKNGAAETSSATTSKRSSRAKAEPAPAVGTETVAPGMRTAAAWSWRILVVAGLIALVLFLIVQLRAVVVPFLIGVLLSALLAPFAGWLQRHGWPKWLAITVNMIGILVVVAGLVTLVIVQVRAGYSEIEAQAIERYDEFTAWLLASPLHLTQEDINAWVGGLVQAFQLDSSILVNGALEVGSTAGSVLVGFLLALFTALFILVDGRGIWRWFVKLFPQKARPPMVGAGEAGWITLTTFVKVQVFVAFVDAVGIALGAWIIGLVSPQSFPLIIPIAVIVFLGSFIPFVGAVVTGAFAVFVALVFLGPWEAVAMLAVVIGVQQIEGNVLQPFVMGTAVKVHPLAVVLAVTSGSLLAGIAGALFAVPLVAVLNVVVGYIARGEWRHTPHPTVADVIPPTPRKTRRAR